MHNPYKLSEVDKIVSELILINELIVYLNFLKIKIDKI